ncbi:fatty acyl-CoA reductase wat-like [Tenebrio molitor]|uniref:fatty acyl-CoA reductase wat-like n=1 Tax=Tenebrio molitor TaxID=7067 RepID=UPI0036248A20
MSTHAQIEEFYKEQTIFLTGGTGFLGKILIEKLLRQCWDLNKIYVLVRPKKDKSPEERFEELFEYPCFDRIKCKNLSEKVFLISGDIQKPFLGLRVQDAELLKKETTCVIHAAANVKFDQTLKEASHNVRAPRDVLELAKHMPNLKVFVHVSTAFSNCVHSHIEERFYTPPMKSVNLLALVDDLDDNTLQAITPKLLGEYPNTYIYTKCITEDLVKTNLQVPKAIVRPAIVTSTIQEPVPGWVDNLYGVIGITLAAALGILRSMHAKKNNRARLVPVDYVANCILAAAWKTHRSGTTAIYNYTGDTKNMITWGEYMEIIDGQCWDFPTEKIVWYFCFKLRENELWHKICVFFLHTVAAYFADFVLICVGRATIAVKNYRRLDKMMDLISYFSMRSWSFEQDNVLELWDQMGKEDKKMFKFSMEDTDWVKYARDSISGARMYLLKETLDTIPKGKKKLKIMFVVHYAVVALFWYLLYKFLMFVASYLYKNF